MTLGRRRCILPSLHHTAVLPPLGVLHLRGQAGLRLIHHTHRRRPALRLLLVVHRTLEQSPTSRDATSMHVLCHA
ncbi:unnamed protein product [Musa hybrid cultivar]